MVKLSTVGEITIRERNDLVVLFPVVSFFREKVGKKVCLAEVAAVFVPNFLNQVSTFDERRLIVVVVESLTIGEVHNTLPDQRTESFARHHHVVDQR